MSKQLPDLSQFSGSQEFYRHLFHGMIYTEGWKYLADEVGAHWLLDLVASYIPTLRRARPDEHLFLWELKLDGKDGCTVSCRRDTGEPAIVEQHIEYTDFPEDFSWYLGKDSDWVCMLKSEY